MKKYFREIALDKECVDFIDEIPLWSAPFGLKLLDKIDYRKGISALDIGFGSGFPLIELAMRLGESSTVYGIDPWTDAIDRARKRMEYYGLTNIRIMEGVAENIPLEDDSIDLIISNNGLNNVAKLEQVLSECSRVCKKGGQFVMTMNLDTTMHEFYSEFELALRELGLENEIKLMYEHIYHKRKPVDEMTDHIRRNGFIIRDIQFDQFDYKFADGSAMLNHFFIRLAFMDSWLKIIPNNRREEIFDIIETRINEKCTTVGDTKLSIPFVTIDSKKE